MSWIVKEGDVEWVTKVLRAVKVVVAILRLNIDGLSVYFQALLFICTE